VQTPATQVDVLVIGSINVDYRVEVDHRPEAGETVLGGDTVRLPGGKGANQAVAAARAGARVAFVGCVGDDPDGDLAVAALQHHGVDVSRVRVDSHRRTGNAFIFVTPDGENTIVVASGANHAVAAADALSAVEAVSPAIILMQGELPALTTAAVLEAARDLAPDTVLNAAPTVTLPDTAMEAWAHLVVNAGEAAQLLGGEFSPDEAASGLRRREEQSVVITLGPDGAVSADANGIRRTPAQSVEVVDTTGAGDAFVGALAAGLARGNDLLAAVEAGVAAGAEAVGRAGAQPPAAP